MINTYPVSLDEFKSFFLREAGVEYQPFPSWEKTVWNVGDICLLDNIYYAFDKSMRLCFELLGETAFKRPDPNNQGCFLKINKTIFEVLSVSIANLSVQEQDQLVRQTAQFKNALYDLFTQEDFIKSCTSGTAKVPQVDYRHSHVQRLIKDIISHD